MAEFESQKPFSGMEKIPLHEEQEGSYVDIYALQHDPRWIIKEQKDQTVWPEEYFNQEVERAKNHVDLAEKYFGESLAKTMIVVGEADAGKNKYENPKKIYFAQERIEGKSLYEADRETILGHAAELDVILTGIVRMYEDTLAQNRKSNKTTGIMLDFHVGNILIGKRFANNKETKEQLWIVDTFPMADFLPPEDFSRVLEERLNPLLHKGIDIKGIEFSRFQKALSDFRERTT